MKKKQLKELHQKSVKELDQLGEKIQKELVQLRIDWGAGKLKNVNQITQKNRDLARVKTIMREKELASTGKKVTQEKTVGS
jgi:large subunit ribosomal protein L29